MSRRVGSRVASLLQPILSRPQHSLLHSTRLSLSFHPSVPPSAQPCLLCLHPRSLSTFARRSQRPFAPTTSRRQRANEQSTEEQRHEGQEMDEDESERITPRADRASSFSFSSPPRSDRPLTEQEEYEKELRLLFQQQEEEDDSRHATPSSSSDDVIDESDVSPELVGFFDSFDVDVDSDPDLAAFTDSTSSLTPSVRRLYLNRMIRMKHTVRQVVADELMAQPSLLGLPLHCHSTRLSTDLQHITVVWHLAPVKPSSSLIRLPSSMKGRSLRSVLDSVQRVMEGCVGRIRRRLAEEVPGKYVPHVRFVFDDTERQRRKKEMEQQRRVVDTTRDNGLDSVDLDHFRHYSPFWVNDTTQRVKPTTAAQGSAVNTTSRLPTLEQRRERRLAKQRRQQRQRTAEVRRTGIVNGEKRYAVPISSEQGGGAAGHKGRKVKGLGIADIIAREKRMREV